MPQTARADWILGVCQKGTMTTALVVDDSLLIRHTVCRLLENHGFSVEPDSLKDGDVELTHINLNDQTLEGFRHRSEPIMAVQYHPEAAPGPHDSFYLFGEFMNVIEEWKG